MLTIDHIVFIKYSQVESLNDLQIGKGGYFPLDEEETAK